MRALAPTSLPATQLRAHLLQVQVGQQMPHVQDQGGALLLTFSHANTWGAHHTPVSMNTHVLTPAL